MAAADAASTIAAAAALAAAVEERPGKRRRYPQWDAQELEEPPLHLPQLPTAVPRCPTSLS